ncbi:glycosyltransferase family 2 protein [Vibrio aestuarianus]|uniref:glycosyltransferase family 2 protein n=1 Tax=Vibrio aestuarianus TaxID=28171 RepID=UPI00237CB863|nr:glycosyltransferase family 2 protein [Vibrio aestuarianus]MDE1329477.1 glycosyltransferase family 2 protein [Vibrio aestuarianus]
MQLAEIKDCSVSAIILTYNSEDTIAKTLNSIINCVDEIIIVDSGSTDATLDAISVYNHNIKVISQNWKDSFSLQRNIGIDSSTSKWCFCIDSDEELTKESQLTFKNTIKTFEKYKAETLFAPKITDYFNKSVLTNNPRIFKKSDDIKYQGRVHEYLNKLEWDVKYIDEIELIHSGYPSDPKFMRVKNARNKKLLTLQMSDEPNDLRWSYFMLRYVKPNSKEFLSILELFGEISLPYPVEYEVYCINVKHKLIRRLITQDKLQEAYTHCLSMTQYYNDIESLSIQKLIEFLILENKYKSKIEKIRSELFEIETLDFDNFIFEEFNFYIVDMIVSRIDEFRLLKPFIDELL